MKTPEKTELNAAQNVAGSVIKLRKVVITLITRVTMKIFPWIRRRVVGLLRSLLRKVRGTLTIK